MEASKRARAAAAAARSRAARDRKRRPTATQNRESDLPVIYGAGCWCGGPFGHDWPGQDQGAPHPRKDWDGPGAEGAEAACPSGPGTGTAYEAHRQDGGAENQETSEEG